MNVRPLPARSGIAPGKDRRTASARRASRTAVHDPRWPLVESALSALRKSGRHAVRIVDADCGAGALLLQALEQARQLGFTAIEGRGIDRSPRLIGRARAAASRAEDPAIGADFAVADMIAALQAEQDFPADIVICPDIAPNRSPEVVRALRNAGRVVIVDGIGAYAGEIAS